MSLHANMILSPEHITVRKEQEVEEGILYASHLKKK